MLVSLEGKKGSGMTMTAVAIAYEEYLRTGRKPILNMGLRQKYKYFTKEDFLGEIMIGGDCNANHI